MNLARAVYVSHITSKEVSFSFYFFSVYFATELFKIAFSQMMLLPLLVFLTGPAMISGMRTLRNFYEPSHSWFLVVSHVKPEVHF